MVDKFSSLISWAQLPWAVSVPTTTLHFLYFRFLGSPKNFLAEKPFVKIRPANSEQLVFSYVIKGLKIKLSEKFRTSRHLRFEDTKTIMSPEIRQKVLGLSRNRPQVLVGSCNNFSVLSVFSKFCRIMILIWSVQHKMDNSFITYDECWCTQDYCAIIKRKGEIPLKRLNVI